MNNLSQKVPSAAAGSDPRHVAGHIVRNLRDKGFQAYLVGGCVRDLLRGVPPKDFDVATDATPDQVLKLFPQSLAVGAKFGVVIARENEQQIEIATFRNDGIYTDHRRPDAVSFSRSPQEDVLRRDFTINGLLMDPESGKVLDFVDGKKDIQQQIIRCIGDPEKRFEEDHLRMLRAVRFATVLGYKIHSETADAIKKLAPKIASISAERVRDEILRILVSGFARRGFELLDSCGLLGIILPEITAMKGIEQPPQFHPEGDVWIHTMLMIEGLPCDVAPELALGVLLHDVGKPPTFRVAPDRIRFDNHVSVGMRLAEQICHRLRMSQTETAQVVALVEYHMHFRDAPSMKASTLKRFLRLPLFAEHLELHRLDCLSSHRKLENYEFVQSKLKEFSVEKLSPPRLITGDDLTQSGYSPGPQYRVILQAVEDAQLEGRLSSREEALQFVREKFTP
ncbi:MAG: phosphohydrolase [Acidobacteria bacterium RIFCSPLOWO2_12_FULL_54_10]|nr:MAG: phosphohydrolase [Acidobacteria bacterium RIFCSPLOWO2_12_FULL_54_10]